MAVTASNQQEQHYLIPATGRRSSATRELNLTKYFFYHHNHRHREPNEHELKKLQQNDKDDDNNDDNNNSINVQDKRCVNEQDWLSLAPKFCHEVVPNAAVGHVYATTTTTSDNLSLEDISQHSNSRQQGLNLGGSALINSCCCCSSSKSISQNSSLNRINQLESNKFGQESQLINTKQNPFQHNKTIPAINFNNKTNEQQPSIEEQLKRLLDIVEVTNSITVNQDNNNNKNQIDNKASRLEMKKSSYPACCAQQNQNQQTGYHNQSAPSSSSRRTPDISPNDKMMLFMLASRSTNTNSTVERNARVLKWMHGCTSSRQRP